jgi:hypothetical protein
VIKTINIEGFKRIANSGLGLDKMNVLVGGNNSGKSCFLQGIHLGVTLSQSQRIAGAQQFPPEKLRYCPTDDFLNLRHGERLTEGTKIGFTFEREIAENNERAVVELTRGRNGVVKAVVTGNLLLSELSDPKGFFSIYVPGLAGITIREEYRSDLVVNNGIARGDANLYLRNVLLRIGGRQDRRARFDKLLSQVFPGHNIETKFDLANDLWISSEVLLPNGARRPLDSVGTGLLQAVQLLAYVTNYTPKLLLLDEPDAHLHPNNQRLLAKTLQLISEETDTQIILATHSRHLLDALSEFSGARLYWVKEGNATQQADWSDVSILMDLGALDRGEQFLNGNYRYLVWTEDTDDKYLQVLIEANNIPMDQVLLFSYQASSKVDAATLMSQFVSRVRPGVRVIIHRDRDFMTQEEIERLKRKYNLRADGNVRLLFTTPSDVEAYFARPEHISARFGIPVADARTLVEDVVRGCNAEFILKFRDKREEIKRDLYKQDPDACPATAGLIPPGQLPVEQAQGKLLLARLGPPLQQRGHNPGNLAAPSPALADAAIVAAFN